MLPAGGGSPPQPPPAPAPAADGRRSPPGRADTAAAAAGGDRRHGGVRRALSSPQDALAAPAAATAPARKSVAEVGCGGASCGPRHAVGDSGFFSAPAARTDSFTAGAGDDFSPAAAAAAAGARGENDAAFNGASPDIVGSLPDGGSRASRSECTAAGGSAGGGNERGIPDSGDGRRTSADGSENGSAHRQSLPLCDVFDDHATGDRAGDVRARATRRSSSCSSFFLHQSRKSESSEGENEDEGEESDYSAGRNATESGDCAKSESFFICGTSRGSAKRHSETDMSRQRRDSEDALYVAGGREVDWRSGSSGLGGGALVEIDLSDGSRSGAKNGAHVACAENAVDSGDDWLLLDHTPSPKFRHFFLRTSSSGEADRDAKSRSQQRSGTCDEVLCGASDSTEAPNAPGGVGSLKKLSAAAATSSVFGFFHQHGKPGGGVRLLRTRIGGTRQSSAAVASSRQPAGDSSTHGEARDTPQNGGAGDDSFLEYDPAAGGEAGGGGGSAGIFNTPPKNRAAGKGRSYSMMRRFRGALAGAAGGSAGEKSKSHTSEGGPAELAAAESAAQGDSSESSSESSEGAGAGNAAPSSALSSLVTQVPAAGAEEGAGLELGKLPYAAARYGGGWEGFPRVAPPPAVPPPPVPGAENCGPFLAPQPLPLAGRPTLVLDLDETLIHSSFVEVKDFSFVIPVEIDGHVHQIYVSKRPGVDDFLRAVAQKFEVVIFTASLAKYAQPLMDRLDPHSFCSSRLFREKCVFWNGSYVKDLSRLGRELGRTIIVDNSPNSYAFQPDNAVPVSSWFSDRGDQELYHLLPYLMRLAAAADIPGAIAADRRRLGMTGGFGSGADAPAADAADRELLPRMESEAAAGDVSVISAASASLGRPRADLARVRVTVTLLIVWMVELLLRGASLLCLRAAGGARRDGKAAYSVAGGAGAEFAAARAAGGGAGGAPAGGAAAGGELRVLSPQPPANSFTAVSFVGSDRPPPRRVSSLAGWAPARRLPGQCVPPGGSR